MCSPYWNVLGDQILNFLEFFYYLLSHFENCWSNDGLTKQWNRWISDFQSGLINGKKIPKNVKFGLQAHFNMENTSNGFNRLFRIRKLKNELVVFRPKYNWKHISYTPHIYIYRWTWLSHGAKCICTPRHIFISKVQLTDPNHSKCSPYWNVETKFYIFWNFLTIY